MASVIYNFVTVTIDGLWEAIESINKYQDKIVAVTLEDGIYTIFYEDRGNAKDGE